MPPIGRQTGTSLPLTEKMRVMIVRVSDQFSFFRRPSHCGSEQPVFPASNDSLSHELEGVSTEECASEESSSKRMNEWYELTREEANKRIDE